MPVANGHYHRERTTHDYFRVHLFNFMLPNFTKLKFPNKIKLKQEKKFSIWINYFSRPFEDGHFVECCNKIAHREKKERTDSCDTET